MMGEVANKVSSRRLDSEGLKKLNKSQERLQSPQQVLPEGNPLEQMCQELLE